MRPLALLPLGVAVGIAAEWVSFDGADLGLVAADLAVGIVLIGGGAVAWERRPESRSGAIMALAGFTWFLGTAFEPALFLHRGPLVHLFLSYPTGRLPSGGARIVVAAAYLVSAVEPLADDDAVTIALGAAVALVAVREFGRMSGTARKARAPALGAALAFAGVLAVGAAARRGGWDDGDAVLLAYDAVVAVAAIVLVVDLSRSRWADAVVTGLVVDLGAPGEVATLRGKLAQALGDPSLVVGYRLHETAVFVDDAGRPVELPAPASGRALTAIEDDGERIAVLVHDEALVADPDLVESVAAAARIAVANALLQAEARARAEELDASRRRIVEAGDAQRRRLEEELSRGAERRLDSVAALLADARTTAPTDSAAIEALEADLDAARQELREFAHGVHPAALTEAGLMSALTLLAERSPTPVEVRGALGTLPAPVEATLFFVCSEALANAIKHAAGSRVTIDVRARRGSVAVSIADDGVGGAALSGGTGLRGLADRVDAQGGTLLVESLPGAGTRVIAEIPLG